MATTITSYSGWYDVGLGEYRLRITLSRSSVNIANNTSTVRSRVWVESRNGGWFTNISSAHGQSIDGIQVYSGNLNRTVGQNSSALVLDNSRTVTHNAAGARTVGSAASFSNYATGNMYVSTSLVLDTIPRATTPTVSGNAFTTGQSTTINLPYATSSFRHDLTFRIGSEVVHTISNAASSTSWTPPHDLATRFTNSASTTVQITTVTKTSASGSSVGSKVNNFTLNAGASIVPTVTQVAWQDQNPLTTNNVGALVQGQSRIKGVVTASGIYGSTITTRSVSVDGVQYSDSDVIELPKSGVISASGTAIDSRNRSATADGTFNVLPYEVPQLGDGGFQVLRASPENPGNPNGNWVPDDLGTRLIIDLDAFASSLVVSSVEKNALHILVETRPASGGVWTTRNTISPGLSYDGRIKVTGGSQFPVQESFEVRITLTDNVVDMPTELITTIPTATVALDMNGTSVGVGKYHERGTLDVAGDGYFSGDLKLTEPDSVLDVAGDANFSGNLNLTDSGVLLSPYGERGNDYRGTTAQRVDFGSSGLAKEGTRFYDTNESLEYIWKDAGWRRAVQRGTLSISTGSLSQVGSTGVYATTITISGIPAVLGVGERLLLYSDAVGTGFGIVSQVHRRLGPDPGPQSVNIRFIQVGNAAAQGAVGIVWEVVEA